MGKVLNRFKERSFIVSLLCVFLTLQIMDLMAQAIGQMHAMYGGVDPLFLMAAGMLVALPLLIKEAW